MKKLSLILSVIFLLSTALDAQVDKKKRRKIKNHCGKTRIVGANGHMLKKSCKYKKKSTCNFIWAPIPGK
jgi:hypothetical protein